MGGCISSKTEPCENNPHLYRVVNIDALGNSICTGDMSINRAELTLVCPNREPMHWPLNGVRRYGCETNMFTFEAGRRCQCPEGVYAFRCARAEQLFLTLQMYIQNPARSVYSEPYVRTDGPPPAGPALPLGPRPNGGHSAAGSSSQLAIPANATGQPPHQYTEQQVPNGRLLLATGGSPSGSLHHNMAASAMHMRSLRLSSASSSGGIGTPLSPSALNASGNGSPATIAAEHSAGNLYQEFRNAARPSCGDASVASGQLLAERNNNTALLEKKHSLDVPPAEPAPSPGHFDDAYPPMSAGLRCAPFVHSPTTPTAFYHNGELLGAATYANAGAHALQQKYDTVDRAYMNVLLGDEPAASAPQSPGPFSPLVADAMRPYENLDLPVRRPKPPSLAPLFEPPPAADLSGSPTGQSPSMLYIELDLDQPLLSGPSSDHLSATPTLCSSPLPSPATAAQLTAAASSTQCAFQATVAPRTPSNSGSFSAAVPDSPTKYANVDGVMDYAKIDFNKTMALSNSTTPSTELDSEESRRTRHSSVAKPPVGFGEA